MSKPFPDYHPPNPNLWKGRKDSLPDERYFQRVNCLSLEEQDLPDEPQLIFLGFASDAGVIRNLGRAGAKDGPDQIRIQLAKLPCHSKVQLLDIGNIACANDNLESAQEQFASLISLCHKKGHKTVAFGGGHEIAWPHFKGLSTHYPKIGIINFDAHFDLRPIPADQRGNSGTPFSQIAKDCQDNQSLFSYCCLGIQETGNTASLFERAKELNVPYLTAEEMNTNSFAWQTAFIDEFLLQHQYIYLSICLDVFSECYAAGVSAPQPLGISPWQAIPLLKYILQTGKVISMDIAELSPPLDENERTARLAAILVAKLTETNRVF